MSGMLRFAAHLPLVVASSGGGGTQVALKLLLYNFVYVKRGAVPFVQQATGGWTFTDKRVLLS